MFFIIYFILSFTRPIAAPASPFRLNILKKLLLHLGFYNLDILILGSYI
jgi:hypothetical protein